MSQDGATAAGVRPAGAARLSWPVRAGRSVAGFGLAAIIVIPVIPNPLAGPLAAALRRIGVVQTWNMYAPDPQRAHSYLGVHAELADGTIVPLAEADAAEAGWTSARDWEKRRVDIWRTIAVLHADRPNVNRTWYLRALCVREERARGVAPRKIIAERVRRRFTDPAAVAAGKPALGEVVRTPVLTVDCSNWPERGMIAADRARRGLPVEEPPAWPRQKTAG